MALLQVAVDYVQYYVKTEGFAWPDLGVLIGNYRRVVYTYRRT